MPALAQNVALPARSFGGARPRSWPELDRAAVGHRAVLEISTADDVAAGMRVVAGIVRDVSRAARVEWWAPGDDGVLSLLAADGNGRGVRHELPLGCAGLFVVVGGHRETWLVSTLSPLEPIIRRRNAEEALARKMSEFLRRSEALDDFAALVAHELKAPLHAALGAGDPSGSLEPAVDLVDALLALARGEDADASGASVRECLDQALSDLGGCDLEVTAELCETMPLPPAALRVILRNLVANARAAGARHVRLTAHRSAATCRLHVDDDGVGMGADDGYEPGSGLGFGLCSRLAARAGGSLELVRRPTGGTRATLVLEGALR